MLSLSNSVLSESIRCISALVVFLNISLSDGISARVCMCLCVTYMCVSVCVCVHVCVCVVVC